MHEEVFVSVSELREQWQCMLPFHFNFSFFFWEDDGEEDIVPSTFF